MLDSTERKKKRVFHLSLLVNLRKFAWIPSFVRSYSFCTFHVSSRRYRSLIWLKRLMRLWIHITCVVFLCKRRRHRFCLLKLSFVVSVIAYHHWIYIKVVVFKLFSSCATNSCWFICITKRISISPSSPHTPILQRKEDSSQDTVVIQDTHSRLKRQALHLKYICRTSFQEISRDTRII